MKIDDFELEVKEGKIVGKTSISIDSNDPALAKRRVSSKIEKLATILSLIFGTAYETDDLNVIHKPIIEKTESGQIVSVFDKIRIAESVVIIQKYSKEFFQEQYNIWRDKLQNQSMKST